jgi:hypothetical protein
MVPLFGKITGPDSCRVYLFVRIGLFGNDDEQ